MQALADLDEKLYIVIGLYIFVGVLSSRGIDITN